MKRRARSFYPSKALSSQGEEEGSPRVGLVGHACFLPCFVHLATYQKLVTPLSCIYGLIDRRLPLVTPIRGPDWIWLAKERPVCLGIGIRYGACCMGNVWARCSPASASLPDEVLAPQGLYTDHRMDNVDMKKLRKMIMKGKLSPCWPGTVRKVTK